MPRFSIKSLLLATTFIAVGMGLICVSYQIPVTPHLELLQLTGRGLAGLGGYLMIGAGLMTPFKRPWTGAIITLAILILYSLVTGLD